ncbi:MAG: hypothetical protein IKR41_11645 [Bacteroidales bacterium]|nr:hypothetical protein [Bacteroidales bacterium]
MEKTENFFESIRKYLQKEWVPSLRFAPGVPDMMAEARSSWAFSFDLKNSTSETRTVAVLPSVYNTDHIVSIDSDGKYKANGGGLVQTPLKEGGLINLNDSPDEINRYSGLNVDCVCSQRVHNAATENNQLTQAIFADETGMVTCTSKNGMNVFQEFVRHVPLRVFQMQISASQREMFSTHYCIKQANPMQQQLAREINLEDYFRPDNALANKIIVDAPHTVSGETLTTLTLPPGAAATVTLRVSALYSIHDDFTDLTDLQDFYRNLADKSKTNPAN